jgi:hypothetical protein
MTIATSRSHEFNVGQICRLAYREAGLLNVYQEMTTQQTSAATDFLELIVHSTETEGLFARSGDTESVTLATDVDSYTLSVNVLDLYGQAKYIAAGQTEVELVVIPMSREEWQAIDARITGGPPSRYYHNRTTSPSTVVLWPKPSSSESGATVRFQIHRLRADVTSTTVTPDFEVFWSEYFVLRLAMKLASSATLPEDRVARLERQSLMALQKCRGKANQSTDQQIVIRHRRMR